MQIIVGMCRYLLPALAFVILFKCFQTLLIGHPVNKTYAYIINRENGERIPLNTWETSIGRSKSCDIMIELPTVSRFHAVICRRVDGWYLFDTVSKGGTFLNGVKIEKGETVKNGDEITFADRSYIFTITDDPIIKVGKKNKKSKGKNKKEALNEVPKPHNTAIPVDSFITTDKNETDNVQREPFSFSPLTEDEADMKPFDIDMGSVYIDFHPKKKQGDTYPDIKKADVFSGSSEHLSRSSDGIISNKTAVKRQAKLVDLNTGEKYLLYGNRITVGRSRNNDIRLTNSSVSRSHALLISSGNKWYISDTSSTYGTFVNEKKVTSSSVVIRDGDILRLGEAELEFIYK